jgi:hypothetical protein
MVFLWGLRPIERRAKTDMVHFSLSGRATIGYDHGYDGQLFYLGLALDERYVEGWVEGCLERIGEDDPDEELLFRDLWEDETQREVVLDSLQADCEVKTGRPPGL